MKPVINYRRTIIALAVPFAGAGSNPGISAGAFAHARRQDRHRPLDRPTLRQGQLPPFSFILDEKPSGIPPLVALDARRPHRRTRMSFCARSPTPTPAADSEVVCDVKGYPGVPGRGMGAAFPQYVGREFRAAYTREGRGFRYGLPRCRSAENPLCRRQQDFKGRLCAPHRGVPHGTAVAHRTPRRTFVGGGFPFFNLEPRLRGRA